MKTKIKMTATRRKKAVAIAKDVIAQLRLKRLIADTGIYCRVYYDDAHQYFEDAVNLDHSFQETFKNDKKVSCGVCAMGAVFIGYINRFNEVVNDSVKNVMSTDIVTLLDGIFSEFQLRLMEFVFEGNWEVCPAELDDCPEEKEKLTRKGQQYYDKYPDDNQRLRAIMLNVVRNNGEFVLPQRIR